MTYRIIPRAFISNGCLYGPGRHDFGYAVHEWWIAGNTQPDDGSAANLPDSLVQIITVEGIQGAYHRLAARLGHRGGPPITITSL
jgi:hypothetical protein